MSGGALIVIYLAALGLVYWLILFVTRDRKGGAR